MAGRAIARPGRSSRRGSITGDQREHGLSYVYIESVIFPLDRSFVLNSCYQPRYLLDTEYNTQPVSDQFSTKPVYPSP